MKDLRKEIIKKLEGINSWKLLIDSNGMKEWQKILPSKNEYHINLVAYRYTKDIINNIILKPQFHVIIEYWYLKKSAPHFTSYKKIDKNFKKEERALKFINNYIH